MTYVEPVKDRGLDALGVGRYLQARPPFLTIFLALKIIDFCSFVKEDHCSGVNVKLAFCLRDKDWISIISFL